MATDQRRSIAFLISVTGHRTFYFSTHTPKKIVSLSYCTRFHGRPHRKMCARVCVCVCVKKKTSSDEMKIQ